MSTTLLFLASIGGGSWLAWEHGHWLGPMAQQYYQTASAQAATTLRKVVSVAKALTAKPAPPGSTVTTDGEGGAANSPPMIAAPSTGDKTTPGTQQSASLSTSGAGDGTGAQIPAVAGEAPMAVPQPQPAKPANPLAASGLWRYIEQEYPEWYAQRAREATSLKADVKDDHAIRRLMAQKLLALRQEHAADALKSSPERLQAIAAGFLKNLKILSAHSIKACYGFISNGEFHPDAVGLMSDPAYSEPLDAQTLAILQAAVEGGKNAIQPKPPKPDDYRALGTELMSRGWSMADLQLFTDPVALSSAPPEKVCGMVQTWFAAQLALTDRDAQLRLLVQSLRPVIAG